MRPDLLLSADISDPDDEGSLDKVIKHPDVAFVHGRGEGIFKEVRSIFKTNG